MKSLCVSYLCVALLLCLMQSTAWTQAGVSSGSVTHTRSLSNPSSVNRPESNYYYAPAPSLVLPDEIKVEEFVNFHRHNLPLPHDGKSVAMDLRWGNGEMSLLTPEAILQIGFTTAKLESRANLRPLNLALVIDKSGSMADANKMSRVKQALLKMVSQLRPHDVVSLVVFDTYASVLLPAQRVGNGNSLQHAINCLEPYGSTNLHDGLMFGYKEACKHFNSEATNRVILLTDGIANVGVTDPMRIAQKSSEYNSQDIDLSTIGVGLDLDKNLLGTLAKSGRGLFHFVGDNEDIEKVFVKELQSLLSPVARKVELSIDYDPRLELVKLYGYAPEHCESGIKLDLEDMNNGLTQVVMLKFKTYDKKASRPFIVRARLSYFDLERRKQVEETKEIALRVGDAKNCDVLSDAEVKKNYTIAQLAQALYDMTKAGREADYLRAESVLNSALAQTSERYSRGVDKDINYTMAIAERYRNELRKFNQYSHKRKCDGC